MSIMGVTLGHGNWQEIVLAGDRVVMEPGCDGNWNLSRIYGLVILDKEYRLCVREDARHGGKLYILDSRWRKTE